MTHVKKHKHTVTLSIPLHFSTPNQTFNFTFPDGQTGPPVQCWPVAESILNAHRSAAVADHLHIPAVDFDTAGSVRPYPASAQ